MDSFFDEAAQRIIIPVQFGFSPQDTRQTAAVFERIGVISGIIGPHWSTLQNEKRVMADVESVSWIGTLLLLCLIGLFGLLGRGRVIAIIPPVMFTALVSAIATKLVFGSIHGLTISFGTAIIGLAMDYGLHAAFSKRSGIWVSNFYGLLTTLVGLIILMTSSVPLLRQMMFFSALGLLLGFLSLFLLFRFKSNFCLVEPFRSVPKHGFSKTWIAVALTLSGIVGLATLTPALDLKQLDFQDSKTKELSNWMVESGFRPPLFMILGEDSLNLSHQQKNFAEKQNISIETIANYLPPTEVQEKNSKTWECSSLSATLNEGESEFFLPFLQSSSLRSISRLPNTSASKGRGKFLSLFQMAK